METFLFLIKKFKGQITKKIQRKNIKLFYLITRTKLFLRFQKQKSFVFFKTIQEAKTL